MEITAFSHFVPPKPGGKIPKPLVLESTRQADRNGAHFKSIQPFSTELLSVEQYFNPDWWFR